MRGVGAQHMQTRCKFVKDSPDVVTYQVTLRTELNMRIVMPAVVKHDKAPYKCMTRFETGPGGNPHAHGFSMSNAGPKVT